MYVALSRVKSLEGLQIKGGVCKILSSDVAKRYEECMCTGKAY